jgi:hypothetical protein
MNSESLMAVSCSSSPENTIAHALFPAIGRRGAADRGEYRQAAARAIAQIKKAPTQTLGPSDYQQKITLHSFPGSLTAAR